MMLLRSEDLCFAYGKDVVLNAINFSVDEGDRLMIIGNNGVGKSTLLKCISNVIKPQAGSIYLNGINLKSYKQKELAKLMAYVPQSITFNDQNVFESILLGRKPYITFQASKDDYRKTEMMINQLSLNHLAQKDTSKLSGGEKQKIAIARALNQDSKILLMDEPTANLDIKKQLDLANFIVDISTKKKITMIISMHDINLALKIGTKFLVLKDSTIYSFGGKSTITTQLIQDVFDVNLKTINDHEAIHFIYD